MHCPARTTLITIGPPHAAAVQSICRWTNPPCHRSQPGQASSNRASTWAASSPFSSCSRVVRGLPVCSVCRPRSGRSNSTSVKTHRARSLLQGSLSSLPRRAIRCPRKRPKNHRASLRLPLGLPPRRSATLEGLKGGRPSPKGARSRCLIKKSSIQHERTLLGLLEMPSNSTLKLCKDD